MNYQPINEMRGVWGIEDRIYSAAEIEASHHLRSARNAGAFVLVAESASEPAANLSADKHTPKRASSTREN